MPLGALAIKGAAAIFMAIAMIGIAVLVKNRQKRQFNWDRVPATVVASHVQITQGIGANVEYEYVLDGRKYRGIRIRTLAIDWGFLIDPARRTVDKYPVGSSITIFVDPNDAENAVIEPGGDRKFLPFVFVGASMVFYAGIRWILAAAN